MRFQEIKDLWLQADRTTMAQYNSGMMTKQEALNQQLEAAVGALSLLFKRLIEDEEKDNS